MMTSSPGSMNAVKAAYCPERRGRGQHTHMDTVAEELNGEKERQMAARLLNVRLLTYEARKREALTVYTRKDVVP